MNKQKVPKLRFPEFTGEWEEKKLGEISKNINYGMNSASKEYDGKNKYIRITDINDENNRFIPNPLTSPLEIVDERFKLKKNDLLFARTGASTGKTYLYKEEDGNIFFAGFLIKFEIKNKYNSKFVFYNTLKNNYKKWVKIMSFRSGQPGINAEEYKILKIKFPSLPEQEKIADFLALFDKEIELEENKLELLKENKKGYMQKIFNQEIRFKDEFGNDYPQWEEKKLGEVLIQGSKQKVKNISDYNKLTIKLNLKGLIKSKPTRKMADRRPFYIRKKGEIIIGKQNYFNGSIAIVSEEFDGFICSNAIMSFKVKKDNIEYIYNYISQNNYLEKYKFLANGTGQKELSEKDFLNFKMILPSLPEQEKITNFLSMADEGIELMENKIEKLKEIKKGLLQQMFI